MWEMRSLGVKVDSKASKAVQVGSKGVQVGSKGTSKSVRSSKGKVGNKVIDVDDEDVFYDWGALLYR